MSLRKLPEIQAFDRPAGVEFGPDGDALARWNPAARAAETDDNVISIYDQIGAGLFDDGVTAKRVAGALRQIGERDVVVNVNSPGGDFFEGIAIYNLLREHPARVTVNVMGLAASAAAVLAMAGDTVRIPEAGFLMVHNAWVVAMGDRHDLREAADFLLPFDEAMVGVFAARSGATRAKAAEWLDRETWFGGAAAVDAGLADEIMAPPEIDEDAGEEVRSTLAVRQVEAALAKQGLSRSQRRSLLGDLKGGTPGAAANATRDAGTDYTDGLRRLIDTMS